jgi:RNA 3'-terminal phosphate cyclase (ATP)
LTAVMLDGSEGEGGGQTLRTALSLSLITGRPFEIARLRSNRSPSGLRPQHLACVRGAEVIGSGHSRGAEVGSDRLAFEPGRSRAGSYELDVGSAGSTPLVLQCLFYPLALAGGGSLTLRGGTHLPHSPTWHFLSWIWAPSVAAYGLGLELNLRYAGFYPQGGGEIEASIPPPRSAPSSVDLPSRGALRDVHVTSFVGGLPFHIAERQARSAVAALREHGIYCEAEKLPLPTMRSVGTSVFVRAQFENTAAGFSSLGERGVPAEEVGREAATHLVEFMRSTGALDEHLADQILLPAALLASGLLEGAERGETRFTTSRITDHLTTNARVIERFLPVRIEVSPPGSISIRPV